MLIGFHKHICSVHRDYFGYFIIINFSDSSPRKNNIYIYNLNCNILFLSKLLYTSSVYSGLHLFIEATVGENKA